MVRLIYVNCRFMRRYEEQAKDADRLEPKGKGAGVRAVCFRTVDVASPAYRQDLTRSVRIDNQGKPVHSLQASCVAEGAWGKANRKGGRRMCG